jgi:hypothetical protein
MAQIERDAGPVGFVVQPRPTRRALSLVLSVTDVRPLVVAAIHFDRSVFASRLVGMAKAKTRAVARRKLPAQASGAMKQTEASLLASRLGPRMPQATLRTRPAAPSRLLIHFARAPGNRYVLFSHSPFPGSLLADERGHARENASASSRSGEEDQKIRMHTARKVGLMSGELMSPSSLVIQFYPPPLARRLRPLLLPPLHHLASRSAISS